MSWVACRTSEGRQGTRSPQGRSTTARVCTWLRRGSLVCRWRAQGDTGDEVRSEGPIDGEGTRRVLRGTAQRGAVCRCGSRPLTAASWRRGQRTQRPACLDLTVLRQAHKARRRVDMRTGMVVKAQKHLSQELWAGIGGPERV